MSIILFRFLVITCNKRDIISFILMKDIYVHVSCIILLHCESCTLVMSRRVWKSNSPCGVTNLLRAMDAKLHTATWGTQDRQSGEH